MSDQREHPTEPAEGPRDEDGADTAGDGGGDAGTAGAGSAAHRDPEYGTDSDNPLAAVDDDD